VIQRSPDYVMAIGDTGLFFSRDNANLAIVSKSRHMLDAMSRRLLRSWLEHETGPGGAAPAGNISDISRDVGGAGTCVFWCGS
jgi:hypothetical protein